MLRVAAHWTRYTRTLCTLPEPAGSLTSVEQLGPKEELESQARPTRWTVVPAVSPPAPHAGRLRVVLVHGLLDGDAAHVDEFQGACPQTALLSQHKLVVAFGEAGFAAGSARIVSHHGRCDRIGADRVQPGDQQAGCHRARSG